MSDDEKHVNLEEGDEETDHEVTDHEETDDEIEDNEYYTALSNVFITEDSENFADLFKQFAIGTLKLQQELISTVRENTEVLRELLGKKSSGEKSVKKSSKH